MKTDNQDQSTPPCRWFSSPGHGGRKVGVLTPDIIHRFTRTPPKLTASQNSTPGWPGGIPLSPLVGAFLNRQPPCRTDNPPPCRRGLSVPCRPTTPPPVGPITPPCRSDVGREFVFVFHLSNLTVDLRWPLKGPMGDSRTSQWISGDPSAGPRCPTMGGGLSNLTMDLRCPSKGQWGGLSNLTMNLTTNLKRPSRQLLSTLPH